MALHWDEQNSTKGEGDMRVDLFTYFHNGSYCSSKRANKSIEVTVMISFEHLERTLRAEFRSDVALVGEDDGLESEVSEDGLVVGEIREVDIPDGVGVDEGGGKVEGGEVEGGISRLEGICMDEVKDGTGEAKEPDMSSMLNDKVRSDDHKRIET